MTNQLSEKRYEELRLVANEIKSSVAKKCNNLQETLIVLGSVAGNFIGSATRDPDDQENAIDLLLGFVERTTDIAGSRK